MYEAYEDNQQQIHTHDPTLTQNFPDCVFSSVTINFGPQTVTKPHLDYKNVAGGWCGVRACGNFDPTKGGHLILWDLRLVIEFPPGSVIFLPSALIRHSNVAIRSHETRYSITLYTPGHLFHYVDNGFKTDKQLEAEMDEEERDIRELRRENRWDEMLRRFHVWNYSS